MKTGKKSYNTKKYNLPIVIETKIWNYSNFYQQGENSGNGLNQIFNYWKVMFVVATDVPFHYHLIQEFYRRLEMKQ